MESRPLDAARLSVDRNRLGTLSGDRRSFLSAVLEQPPSTTTACPQSLSASGCRLWRAGVDRIPWSGYDNTRRWYCLALSYTQNAAELARRGGAGGLCGLFDAWLGRCGCPQHESKFGCLVSHRAVGSAVRQGTAQ